MEPSLENNIINVLNLAGQYRSKDCYDYAGGNDPGFSDLVDSTICVVTDHRDHAVLAKRIEPGAAVRPFC